MTVKIDDLKGKLCFFHTRSQALKDLKQISDKKEQDKLIDEISGLRDVSENASWALLQAIQEWQNPEHFELILDWCQKDYTFQKDLTMTLDALSQFGCDDKQLWQAMLTLIHSQTVLEYKFAPKSLNLLLDVDGERKQRISMTIEDSHLGLLIKLTSYCGIANSTHLEDIKRVNVEIEPRRLDCEEFQGNYKVFIREEQHWLGIVSHSLEDIILTLAHAADDLEQQLSGFDLDWKINHE